MARRRTRASSSRTTTNSSSTGQEQIIVEQETVEAAVVVEEEEEQVVHEGDEGGEPMEEVIDEEAHLVDEHEHEIDETTSTEGQMVVQIDVAGIKDEPMTVPAGDEAEVQVDVESEGDGPIAVDDDAPPLLMPEKNSGQEAAQQAVEYVEDPNAEYVINGEYEEYYVDKDGEVVDEQVCCGVCGEVMLYSILSNEHIPTVHPELLTNQEYEEVGYQEWTGKEKYETIYDDPYYVATTQRSQRPLRRVSQIRVKTATMSLAELEASLKKKMIEKLGRPVPVSLVDKQHARCGICNAVVSLNKKFEIVHLVRHFNAWHPSAHKCAGTWGAPLGPGYAKPLCGTDIAVIDTAIGAHDNLQCIWCGMFMDAAAVGMHFHEVHPNEIEVPKCNLCLQEVIINARLRERFEENFSITMPDERHYHCEQLNSTHLTEASLEKAIARYMKRKQSGATNESDDEDGDEEIESQKGPANYSNSRMAFGRRSKPKRHFVMPSLRQAVPSDSQFVEPISDCHWKCKLCEADILAAVISAGTIKHYREKHPDRLQECQMEVCKVRLARLSDGCMEFLSPTEIECLVCHMTYPLHKPFNMCRAVRHLKAKHPQHMPEYDGTSSKSEPPIKRKRYGVPHYDSLAMIPGDEDTTADVSHKYVIQDQAVLDELRERYKVPFTKVLNVQTTTGDSIYILVNDDAHITQESLNQVVQQVEASEPQYDGSPYVVQYAPQTMDDTIYEKQVKQEVEDTDDYAMAAAGGGQVVDGEEEGEEGVAVEGTSEEQVQGQHGQEEGEEQHVVEGEEVEEQGEEIAQEQEHPDDGSGLAEGYIEAEGEGEEVEGEEGEEEVLPPPVIEELSTD